MNWEMLIGIKLSAQRWPDLTLKETMKFWKLYLWTLPTEVTWQFVFTLFSYKKWLWSSKQSLPLSSPGNPPHPKENSVEQIINSSCSWRLKPVFDTFAQQAESKSTINFYLIFIHIKVVWYRDENAK